MNKQLLFQLQKKTFRVTLTVLESAISTQKLSFVDFILARAIVFLISILNMDHFPSPSLVTGNSAEGTNRRWSCWVLPGLSKYALDGKVRKADRGICKWESKAILQHIGVFPPVDSGKYTFFLIPTFVHSSLWWQTSLSRLTLPYQPWRQSAVWQDSAGCYHCRALHHSLRRSTRSRAGRGVQTPRFFLLNSGHDIKIPVENHP